jgi:SAM-dependent methyltransferase
MSLYQRAGIHDVKAFYRTKFAYDKELDYFMTYDPLARFDVCLAKVVWMLTHVRPGSRVLDFGCGSGTLSALKHIGCELHGIELSEPGAQLARSRGYRDVFVGDLAEAPFAAQSFDVVASIDVFGHIEAPDKDAVLAQLERLLKPGGVMLHGIECGVVDYDALDDEALRRYVSVDGHVGMEGKEQILQRFRRLFAHVEGEVRFVHENGCLELLHQHADYGVPMAPDLAWYMQRLTASERRAFDTAMGLVFHSLERGRVPSTAADGGFLFVRASDAPLAPPRWDWAPRNQAPQTEPALVPGDVLPIEGPSFCNGWHGVEVHDGMPLRWAEPETELRLRCRPEVQGLRLTLDTAPTRGIFDLYCVVDGESEPRVRVPMEPGHRYEVTVPFGRRETDLVSVQITATAFMVPSWSLGSPDRRRLAFRLISATAV